MISLAKVGAIPALLILSTAKYDEDEEDEETIPFTITITQPLKLINFNYGRRRNIDQNKAKIYHHLIIVSRMLILELAQQHTNNTQKLVVGLRTSWINYFSKK